VVRGAVRRLEALVGGGSAGARRNHVLGVPTVRSLEQDGVHEPVAADELGGHAGYPQLVEQCAGPGRVPAPSYPRYSLVEW